MSKLQLYVECIVVGFGLIVIGATIIYILGTSFGVIHVIAPH